jgi:hypothetical protein
MNDEYKSTHQLQAEHWRALLDSSKVQPQPLTKNIITEIMRQRIAMKCDATGLTWAQMVADSAIKRAIETGDVRELLDRLEGKVPQAVAHTGADGGDVRINYVVSAEPLSNEEWERQYGHGDRPKIGNGNGHSLVPTTRTTEGPH